MKYQPIDIALDLPSNSTVTGKLVLRTEDQTYLLSFPQLLQEELHEKNLCLSTSPDGKWLAYCVAPDNPVDHWLIVESADGQQQEQLPMGKDWLYSLTSQWLDNERLVFTLIRDFGEVWPVIGVNPFTGAQHELQSDYPDLWPSVSGPAGTLHFLYTSVVYDPSLNLAIYPQTAKGSWNVVLWNRQAKKALATLKDLSEFGHIPLWSPDGRQFAIAVYHQAGKQHGEWIDEWFSVSREGDVQQLTHFGELFEHAAIGFASWSPDGQRLAFWLDARPSMCESQTLVVLEIETQQAIDYCVVGSDDESSPALRPAWSLDNRYIAVQNYHQGQYLRAVLIDIEQGWAAQISEGALPVGWLVNSEH